MCSQLGLWHSGRELCGGKPPVKERGAVDVGVREEAGVGVGVRVSKQDLVQTEGAESSFLFITSDPA